MNTPNKKQIPFLDLAPQYEALKENILSGIENVLAHKQFILGPEVSECEKKLSQFTQVKHTLSCASGTDALLMALMALNVGPGDEVLLPAFSFFGTAEVISVLGAKPVFIDIEKESYNLDPKLLKNVPTQKVKALMTVGLYGQPADMNPICEWAEKKKIPVIEDAAQSFGATYYGKKSGNLSLIGCTSFFPAKPLGCYGDGGALFTNDDELFLMMKQIRVHGDASRYEHVRIGINGRMDTLQCAIILAKLNRFEWEIQKRDQMAQKYKTALKDCDLVLPKVLPHRTSVWAQYTILVENRDKIRELLAKEGVPTAIHYPKAIPAQPVYKNLYNLNEYPVSCEIASKALSLPLYADMPESDQDYVIETLKKLYSHKS